VGGDPRKILRLATTACAVAACSGVGFADPALVQKNTCTSCQGADKEIVRSGFEDMAEKYKGDARANCGLAANAEAGVQAHRGPINLPPNPRVKTKSNNPLSMRGSGHNAASSVQSAGATPVFLSGPTLV
jgi:cytochrome c